jgi:hypothetical protein
MATPAMQIRLKGIEQLMRKMDKRLYRDPIKDMLTRASLEIAGEVRERTPVDTGRLRNSVTSEVERVMPTDVPTWARIGSNVVYAPPVEFGRRPGTFPPYRALQPWARRHGFGPSGGFLVARAIARRGTKGAKMFEKGLAASERRVLMFLNDAARAIESRWRRGRI